MKLEIGDVLFTITFLANSLDINLDKEFSKVINKCYERDKDRFEKK
jgi:NTP pyrophosphatase (non-canonical NTP hydrolase)